MANLETSFAGLKLKNPFIVASCGLTEHAANNQKLAAAGAGAIVLKSLFEEQITLDAASMDSGMEYYDGGDYLAAYVRQHKLGEFLELIKESKKVCDCPVIASINCFDKEGWMDFAQQIEAAGADALEINTLALQTEIDYTEGAFEQRHIDILESLKKAVKLPIIMKLGDNFSNPVSLVNKLYAHGAAAVVLFNRFYPADIDIDKIEQVAGNVLSSPSDICKTLRWVGIVSSRVQKLDVAASGGVHTPQDMVKTILAGAAADEICSALMKNGPEFIGQCTAFLGEWMDKKGFKSIADFKGKLNQKNVKDNSTFERTQFLRYYSSHK